MDSRGKLFYNIDNIVFKGDSAVISVTSGPASASEVMLMKSAVGWQRAIVAGATLHSKHYALRLTALQNVSRALLSGRTTDGVIRNDWTREEIAEVI